MSSIVSDLKYKAYLFKLDFKKTRFYNVHIRKPFKEMSQNVDHDRKFIFVHIPKTAGTSVKNALKLPSKGADHSIPTYMVHKRTWESYYTFAIVRHPIKRFISAYNYTTSPDYKGSLLNKYPDLHSFSIEKYFKLVSKDPNYITPQSEYVRHYFSDEPIDIICRFENLNEDMQKVFKRLKIKAELPHLNVSTGSKQHPILKNKRFMKKVLKFYKEDFKLLDYKKEL
jgi:hypothetical protein